MSFLRLGDKNRLYLGHPLWLICSLALSKASCPELPCGERPLWQGRTDIFDQQTRVLPTAKGVHLEEHPSQAYLNLITSQANISIVSLSDTQSRGISSAMPEFLTDHQKP